MVVDQCQFGLCDPQSKKFYRKRTSLDINSKIFAAALMQQATFHRNPEQHEPIEGRTWVDGKWVNKSLVAGTWTNQFARHILHCAALALTHGACVRQQIAGHSVYVLLSEGQPYLTTTPIDQVCSTDC